MGRVKGGRTHVDFLRSARAVVVLPDADLDCARGWGEEQAEAEEGGGELHGGWLGCWYGELWVSVADAAIWKRVVEKVYCPVDDFY